MRYAFCLAVLLTAVVIAQLAFIPAFLPPVLQPDLGILVAFAVLAFGPREFGVIAVFCMGLQADLFGSARFGVLTLSYLLAAGVVLLAAWRELARGDVFAPWVGGVAGTFFAHAFYVLIAKLFGLQFAWSPVITSITSLLIAACIWGLPVAMICGRWLAWTSSLSPAVRERWTNEARFNAARKGKLKRA
jgi:rod shape-determining protein MreD